jgi:hypothetical protein
VVDAGKHMMYEIISHNFKMKEQSNITKLELDQIVRYQRQDETVLEGETSKTFVSK